MSIPLQTILKGLTSDQLQKEELEYNKAIEEAIGKERIEYENNRKWLQHKWREEKDGTELRLISGIIIDTPSPINASILADNLNYFTKHSGNYDASALETALGRACLCGSRKIAEFILEKLKSSYTASEHEYLLGYVSASQNEVWVEDIANKMAETKIGMPISIYDLAHSDKIIDKIREIFKEGPSIESTDNSLTQKAKVTPDRKLASEHQQNETGQQKKLQKAILAPKFIKSHTSSDYSVSHVVDNDTKNEIESLTARFKTIALMVTQQEEASAIAPIDKQKNIGVQERSLANHFADQVKELEEIIKKTLKVMNQTANQKSIELHYQIEQERRSKEMLTKELAEKDEELGVLRKAFEDAKKKLTTMEKAEHETAKKNSLVVINK